VAQTLAMFLGAVFFVLFIPDVNVCYWEETFKFSLNFFHFRVNTREVCCDLGCFTEASRMFSSL
jgi:predicted membrane channel-forming protein YqfA (hemolysin III family)